MSDGAANMQHLSAFFPSEKRCMVFFFMTLSELHSQKINLVFDGMFYHPSATAFDILIRRCYGNQPLRKSRLSVASQAFAFCIQAPRKRV
jgi:hypothetical protein